MAKAYKVGQAPWETTTQKTFPVGQAPWEMSGPKPTESAVGNLPGVKQLSDFGVGVGTNIGKAGLGLAQTALKGANVLSNLTSGFTGVEKNQYDKAIGGLETTKQKLYTEPFEKQLDTLSGKAGNITGEIAQFVSPGGAIVKGQELLTGAFKATDIAQKLMAGGKSYKAANYLAQKGIQAFTEALGTAGTIFGTSGGDSDKAVKEGIAAGAITTLTRGASDVFKAIIPQTVKENVGRVFGISGKKSLSDIEKGVSVDKATGAMNTMRTLAPEIIVTNIDGVQKPFNPLDTNFIELPQALNQSKDLIYSQYTKLAQQAGEQGGSFTARDFYKVIDELDKYSESGYTPAFSTKANQLKEALKRFVNVDEKTGAAYFKTTAPEEIQQLIENVNKDVNPLSDKAGAEVAQKTSQKLREIMDEKITKATGNPEYQNLRDKYSELKSIEPEIISRWKSAMRKAGAQPGLIDGIATLDAMMAILSIDPGNLGRAALIKTIQKAFQYLKNPENNLRRAFKLLDDNAKGVKPDSGRFRGVSPDSDTVKQGEKIIQDVKAIPNKQGGFISTGYKEEGNLTTKILKDLEGKTTVSKQYILDATNRGELKQAERDITRQVLETMKGDKIDVKEFADKVKAELLPLKRNTKTPKFFEDGTKHDYGGKPRTGYEMITLPDNVRGDVADYYEAVYDSPIKTSAGSVHYGKSAPNYFGHTRIEDMADGKTRRVIEVQSDLTQKGGLERERRQAREIIEAQDGYKKIGKNDINDNDTARFIRKEAEQRLKDVQKLEQYPNGANQFRMIREEIRKAAQDGKTKLQFPTGETAMKIEGLGEQRSWFNAENRTIKPDELKVGETAYQMTPQSANNAWVITDVLGDGKFKAIPTSAIDNAEEELVALGFKYPDDAIAEIANASNGIEGSTLSGSSLLDYRESFDISGKVDTSNPIYKFYEKDVQKYLNKYGGKRVTDDKGVTWIEIDIKPEYNAPVEAFGKAKTGALLPIAGATAAGAVVAANAKKK